MLKVEEIRELIKLVDQSNITEFDYEYEGFKIKMKKETVLQQHGAPVIAEEPAVVPPRETVQEKQPVKKEERADPSLYKIVSPMVGTFYQSSSPEADAYVEVGSRVEKETVVCIIEAMKLFNEIEAEVNGEIVEILVKDGQLVEYGQPLFLVKEK
ncbi:acetyl-CoA carboxylase biotin carboxyl carrier protein [Bacillaceae bacterium Marseille-Q3522]|nr:acetyl-CoA carboxylase biotin carboxyl carrier protein [Bacillaceae bacterium Marseille-Q3522]